MNRRAIVFSFICCLLVTLVACGNKGPLVPAEDDEQKQTKSLVVE